MNILECLYTEWGGHEVQSILLKELRFITDAPEDFDFYLALKHELKTEAMHHPVLVVPTNQERLNYMVQHWPDEYLKSTFDVYPVDWDTTDTVNIVVKGNNRVLVARELGYEYIDSILTPVNDYVEVSRTLRRAERQPELNRERTIRR